MKPLNWAELYHYSQWLMPRILGAQLQGIKTSSDFVVLEFYRHGSFFLVFDLRPVSPQLVLSQEELIWVKKKEKPIGLFLKANLKNKFLIRLELDETRGRIFTFYFSSNPKVSSNPNVIEEESTSAAIEFQMIPRNSNLIVRADKKKISWGPERILPENKVMNKKEIFSSFLKSEFFLKSEDESSNRDQFDGYKLEKKWSQEILGQGKTGEQIFQDKIYQIEKSLSKKEKASIILQEQIKDDTEIKLRELGYLIQENFHKIKKSNDYSFLPINLKKLIKENEGPSSNLNYTFETAKLIEKKKEGTRERIIALEKEITGLKKKVEDLKNQKNKAFSQNQLFLFDDDDPMDKANTLPLMKKIKKDIKKRILFEEPGLRVIVGKSAKDNLFLLRMARPWDYWLHLRDFPGAHGIIFRDKNKNIAPSLFEKVAQKLIKESIGHRKIQLNEKFEVVVAECRFVRPIKGDRLGRVTYTESKNFIFASEISS